MEVLIITIFNVDGISFVDSESSAVCESNTHLWSIVLVPGLRYIDTRDVKRSVVIPITY